MNKSPDQHVAERGSLYTLRSQLTDNNVALSEQIASLQGILETLSSSSSTDEAKSGGTCSATPVNVGLLHQLTDVADEQSTLVNEAYKLIQAIKHVLL